MAEIVKTKERKKIVRNIKDAHRVEPLKQLGWGIFGSVLYMFVPTAFNMQGYPALFTALGVPYLLGAAFAKPGLMLAPWGMFLAHLWYTRGQAVPQTLFKHPFFRFDQNAPLPAIGAGAAGGAAGGAVNGLGAVMPAMLQLPRSQEYARAAVPSDLPENQGMQSYVMAQPQQQGMQSYVMPQQQGMQSYVMAQPQPRGVASYVMPDQQGMSDSYAPTFRGLPHSGRGAYGTWKMPVRAAA